MTGHPKPTAPDSLPTEQVRQLVAEARAQADGVGLAAKSAETTAPISGSSRIESGLLADTFPGYQLLAKIHGGGQGVVYKARQLSTGKIVALKVIHQGPLADPRNRARLERGIHILSQLNHPHIVRIIDSGTAAGALFYVMDYIEGHALQDWLIQRRMSSLDKPEADRRGFLTTRWRAAESSRQQRSDIQEILRLFVGICDAVAAAHVRGVIHRDLKPGNIRIDAQGEPYILDFDLAKILPGDLDPEGRWMDMTQTGEFLGSLRWASPEQVERVPAKVDLRTDVYSLGVILYELLTGQSPYPTMGTRRDLEDHIIATEPAPPSRIRRRIEADLDLIILKCLAKEPARRYASASALAEDLRAFLGGLPIRARGDSPWYILRKLARRHAAATVSVAALLAILISTTTISVYFYRREHQASQEKAALAELSLAQARSADDGAKMARDQLHRMALGWFLLEWHADRIQRAKQIRDSLPATAPERLAMQYLLDPTYADERFLAELPAPDSSLGYFIVGERELNGGQLDKSKQSFQTAIKAGGPKWYQDAAGARLRQLADRNGGDNNAAPMGGHP